MPTILMPNVTSGDEVVKALNLLLHDLRTPVGVAQGYLRLLLEDRLTDTKDRQRALAQSMDALGRIGELCAGAGEFANDAVTPAQAHRYQAAELITALTAEAHAKGLIINVQDSRPLGYLRSLVPTQAAAAIATIMRAALRNDAAQPPEISTGVTAEGLLVTSGNAAIRARLIAPTGHDIFNPWRGGNGLLVPLAAKQLGETGARVWTLAGEPFAVAVAIPLESEA
jgi:hypothetical protein